MSSRFGNGNLAAQRLQSFIEPATNSGRFPISSRRPKQSSFEWYKKCMTLGPLNITVSKHSVIFKTEHNTIVSTRFVNTTTTSIHPNHQHEAAPKRKPYQPEETPRKKRSSRSKSSCILLHAQWNSIRYFLSVVQLTLLRPHRFSWMAINVSSSTCKVHSDHIYFHFVTESI